MKNIPEDLRAYIELQRKAGIADEEIRKTLITTGWKEEVVANALTPKDVVEKAKPIPTIPTIPKSTEPISDTTTELIDDREEPEKPKEKKWLRPVMIVMSIIILGVGSWFIWQFITSTERVVVASFRNLIQSDVEQFEFTTELQFLSAIGEIKSTLFSNIKVISRASIDGGTPTKSKIITRVFSATEGIEKEWGSLEIRWLGSIVYLRLELIAEDLKGFGLEEYDAKWFSIDTEKILNDSGLNDQYEFDISEEDTNELIAAYMKNQFIIVVDNLGTKNIANQQTSGYQLSYDQEKLAKWLAEVEVITDQPNPRTADEFSESIPKPEDIGVIKVWISDETNFPISFEYELLPTETKSGVRIKLVMNSMGKAIDVVRPEPVTPLDELLNQYVGNFSETAKNITESSKQLFSSYQNKNN